jgi:hypothetical protein
MQTMGITEYPTFILFYPKEGFQQKFFFQGGDLENLLYNWASNLATQWREMSENNSIVPLTTASFPELVLNSGDFWVVIFTGGRMHSKARCDEGRMGAVELSAKLKGLAKVGHVECDTETDFCLQQFSDRVLHFAGFPLFKAYSRGANKVSEEIFNFQNVQIAVATEIIEKTVKLLLKDVITLKSEL